MNQNIKEEVKRILEITFYEKSKILESDDHINKIMDKKFKKEDDPKKADLVSANLDDFYKTLEDFAKYKSLQTLTTLYQQIYKTLQKKRLDNT